MLLHAEGLGFIISQDGITLRFTPAGTAVANWDMVYSKSKKDERTNQWETTHEMIVKATAWGDLAEFLADSEDYGFKRNIDVEGELHTETFQRRDGGEGQSVCMTVRKVRRGQTIDKNDGAGSFGSSGASPADKWNV
ncbi:single-stranded DNA-binding protein [Nocardia brasiliensis]|uniref:single-stranded DNA-binding protein n=1 Tax=Nocardia brasiliensis TaxID=37326 RepID=UPI0024565E5A|nr:single-stranded DNA-binding protein [Nocardia brasiliensis]